MKVWLSFRLAYEHLRFGFGRMALSALAIALGVALVVAIQLMNAAVLDAFLDTLDGTAGRAALTASAGEGLTFPEAVRDTVAAVPGVALTVPLVAGVAFPDDGSGELLTVHGVDLTHDAEVRVYHRGTTNGIVDDLVAFLAQPDSLILGREFAARRGLGVGSPLSLVTPHGVQRFTVRGLLDPEGLAKTLGGRLVVMDLYAAERAFTADGQINQLDLLITPGADLVTVRTAVAAVLPPGLKVEEPALRKAVLRRTIAGFQAMLTAFALLAVVAGFVICYSRLGSIFEARAWEVGVLRAVGLERAVVFGELLKESLLLGVVGTAVGLPLGVLIGHKGLPVIASATAINFHMPVPTAAPEFEGSCLVLGPVIGLLAAALGAALPALRLARRSPAATLCLRGREHPIPTGPRIWTSSALLLLVLGLLLGQATSHSPTLGNITTAVAAVAACALAGPIVRLGGAALGKLLSWMFGAVGEFAAGHLVERPRRVTLTVATLGVGLGAILMFGILAHSLQRSLVTQLTPRNRADLIINSSFATGGWISAPLAEGILHDIRLIPDVADADGEQRKDLPYGDGLILLDAYDFSCVLAHRPCEFPLDPGASPNALDALIAGEGVIVSAPFAYQFRIRPEDTLVLDSPHGPQIFRVVGITRSEPTTAVVMHRERYRRTWNDELISWVHVTLREPALRSQVAQEIAAQLGQRDHLQIRSGSELVEFFVDQARQAFSVTYVMQGITFLLVLIALSDALATAILDRTRQFGMMRAVGLPRRYISQIVILEGLAIGVLGLALATIAGVGLGLFWVEVQFPALLGWQLDLHFPTAFALGAGALTLLICVVASLAPSLRAGRLAIPAALHDE